MPVYIFTTFDNPSATIGTFGNGINDTGQIVGDITTPAANTASSLAAAPTPPSTIPRPPTRPLHKASTTQARSSGGTATISGNHGFLSAAAPTPPSTIPRPPAAP